MSFAFQISINDRVSPLLNRVRKEVNDSRRLNRILSGEVAAEVRNYLEDLSTFRHATANRLGARPTGHLGKAAKAVESGFSETEAFITVPAWTGLSRAFRDVEITPLNGKKWLTIPANKRSYGRSAGDFDNLKFIPLGNDLAMLAGEAQSTREVVPMYWLKRSVRQKQDRTLLPSEEELQDAVELAAGEWLKIIISQKGGLIS